MKKEILSLIFLPLVISNFNSSSIESVVKSEATGENASVKAGVTNIVNQNVTRVVSTQSGEIKVEVHDGTVKIESSPEVTPIITIYQLSEEEVKKTEEEAMSQVEEMKTGLFSFFENLIAKISRVFRFTP